MPTPMTWEQICEDPHLRDLPYKIEQDRYGRIVMSPVDLGHSRYQGRILTLLVELLPSWEIIPECAVQTREGVRVPDVAAIRLYRSSEWKDVSSLPVGPDICVEVISWSNSPGEMEDKRRLFAQQGCREFWTCSEDGEMVFFEAESGRVLTRSEICPEFPERIRLR